MKLTGKDFFLLIVIIGFSIGYFISKEFMLLLLAIGLIPCFYLDLRSKLSYPQKLKSALIMVGIIGILYGIHEKISIWTTLIIALVTMALLWIVFRLRNLL